MANARWPSRVWIVRHGESLGNIASSAAIANDLERIEIAERDVDVPLSALGEEQARAVGKWFGSLPPDEQPQDILVSPYRRTRQTAELIAAEMGCQLHVAVDERLRERDFGVLEHLTRKGIQDLAPEQAEFRRQLGKFYHRPPGGESWCDVVLRLRSLLDTIALHHTDRRVLIVCHQVVLQCFRYILEKLDEQQVLELDHRSSVANGSVTEYEVHEAGSVAHLTLVRENFVAPLERQNTPVTRERDMVTGVR